MIARTNREGNGIRAPWKRLGGKGTFIQLQGMDGVTAQYVVEIPPGGALDAERHLYERSFMC